jgi:hypothetical protein
VDLIEQCVALDKENMKDNFRDGRGNPIQWEKLPAMMKVAIESGAVLCPFSFDDENLEGYLFYREKDDVAFIMSIQVRNPGRNFKALKVLLAIMYNELSNSTVKRVQTVVDKNNERSLAFHHGLGMKVFEERETALCFEASREELISRLSKFEFD